MLATPLAVGLFSNYILNNVQSIPLSLLLSIVGLIYSEIKIYIKKDFINNRRIKTELAVSLMLLAISLVVTIFWWNNQNFQNSVYDVPVILYVVSTTPYFIEMLYALIIKDLKINFKKNKSNDAGSNFNITSANIN